MPRRATAATHSLPPDSPQVSSELAIRVEPPSATSQPPEPRIPKPENLRFLDELADRFRAFLDHVRHVKRFSDFSLRWHDHAFRNFRRFLLRDATLPPPQFVLRIHALDEWVAWNTARGIKDTTMNSYWRGVRAFFVDREKRDGAANPFRDRRAPSMRDRVPKAKSFAECGEILRAAQNYPWATPFEAAVAVAVIGVMLYAGLRRSEVLRLEYRHVDLTEGTLRVERGKGRWGGKDRVAYVPPDLTTLLRAYVRERQRHGVEAPTFFVSPYTCRPLTEFPVRVIVRKVSRASGIPFTPHALRHSYITQLLRSGVPLPLVQRYAGHESVETTMGYYRVFDEDLKDGVRNFRFR